jgi:hypothetical protein
MVSSFNLVSSSNSLGSLHLPSVIPDRHPLSGKYLHCCRCRRPHRHRQPPLTTMFGGALSPPCCAVAHHADNLPKFSGVTPLPPTPPTALLLSKTPGMPLLPHRPARPPGHPNLFLPPHDMELLSTNAIVLIIRIRKSIE